MVIYLKKLRHYFRSLYYSSFAGKSDAQGPVFIVGTGRSGTHYLCSCLNKFEDIDDVYGGRESPHFFYPVSDAAQYGEPLSKSILGYYRKMQKDVSPKIFLDQSHPNIWNVEQLLEFFPDAKFLAISRNVYSVVYSMKMHKGVSGWIKNHSDFPRPNRYLGITKENQDLYDNELDFTQRCVFRWCSHEDRIHELVQRYPDSVMAIQYEDLSVGMRTIMNDVADFIGVRRPTEYSEFNDKSLHKKNLLSAEEVDKIGQALDLYRSFSRSSV